MNNETKWQQAALDLLDTFVSMHEAHSGGPAIDFPAQSLGVVVLAATLQPAHKRLELVRLVTEGYRDSIQVKDFMTKAREIMERTND